MIVPRFCTAVQNRVQLNSTCAVNAQRWTADDAGVHLPAPSTRISRLPAFRLLILPVSRRRYTRAAYHCRSASAVSFALPVPFVTKRGPMSLLAVSTTAPPLLPLVLPPFITATRRDDVGEVGSCCIWSTLLVFSAMLIDFMYYRYVFV